MTANQRDQLAQQAAGLFVAGKAATVGEAIRLVMGSSDPKSGEAPSQGRVRQHIRGMTMQAMGEPAYRASIRAVLETAEQIMTVLEESPLNVRTSLVGRAARGELDGDFRVYVRMNTRAGIDLICDALEQADYRDQRVETANTRFGRLNRVIVTEDDAEYVLTRCPPDANIPRDRDLLKGTPIESRTIDELRRQIDGAV